jgi:hypothetical protein
VRLAFIALAWLTPLAAYQIVSPKKEVVALAAALWVPPLLVATFRDPPLSRWAHDLGQHPLAPFALLYGVAAAYGLLWGFARGNDAVLALGQTYTAGLFLVGFAVAGPVLARDATRDFWLLLSAGVVALSIPDVARVLGALLGPDSHFARFLDPVAVLAPICLLTTLVLVYPLRPALGALGLGCFAGLTLLTFTRSYWIGVTGALLFFVLAAVVGRRRQPRGERRISARAALPAVAAVAGVAVVLALTPIGGFVSDRVAATGQSNNADVGVETDASLVVREEELGAALAHLRAHPVTGLGSGGEYLSLYQASSTEVRFGATNFVHNAYVYLPLKFGMLGFAALAALGLGAVRVAAFALSAESREAAGRVLFTAVLVFFLLASISAPNLVDPKYSLLAGAIAWLAGVPSRAL